jgi:hypothetical protein
MKLECGSNKMGIENGGYGECNGPTKHYINPVYFIQWDLH